MSDLTKALIKFQGLVKNPAKNAKNPHFRSNYVNLDGLLEAVKQPLNDCGLFLTQVFVTNENGTFLLTVLMHESGEKIESYIPISPDKANIQGLGSAITYLRRYSLESICGICGSDDDDGNSAVNTGTSSGSLNNDKPTDKQKKFYFDLLKRHFNNQVPEKDLEEAKKMGFKEMTKAINELKAELGMS